MSPNRAISSLGKHQGQVDNASEDYGVERYAAAALRCLSACSDDNRNRDKIEPFTEAKRAVKRARKRKYKKRKATHTVRKEEIQALEQEMQLLQKELEKLKVKTRAENDMVSRSPRRCKAITTLLTEAVKEQHLVVARAQAMLAGQFQHRKFKIYPTQTKIRLGMDGVDRTRTLMSLRKPKLQEAERFLLERVQGLSPTAPYVHEERYDTINGDFCIERVDVTPIRGAKGGVNEVYAALQHAIFNAEIVISESSGNITIREDDQLRDENLSQMRFVSNNSLGVQLEANLVLFSDRTQCLTENTTMAENGCYAILASDFVDEDQRYPYRPNERIRRDMMSVAMVASYRDTTANATAQGEDEMVVIITRWALSIVRRPGMVISNRVWDELRYSHVCWADLMFNCVRQTLGLPVVQ